MKKKQTHTSIFKDHLWNAIVNSNNNNILNNIMDVIKKGGYRKRMDKNILKPIDSLNLELDDWNALGDDNDVALIFYFKMEAKKKDWSKKRIKQITQELIKADYNTKLKILKKL